MKPGWHRISNEKYHAGPGLSRSPLWTLYNKSPRHSRDPVEETVAMEFGDKFHQGVEDPQAFEEKFVILPEDCRPGSGLGMKGRKEMFESEAERNTQTIINQEDYDTIRGMTAAIHSHPECLDLMEGECLTEISGYWIDPETGLLCKLRADLLNTTKEIVVDWKSCVDARPRPFYRVAWDKGYHFQAAWYLWGVSMITGIEYTEFRDVAVEKKGHHAIQVHPVMSDLLEYAKTECRLALNRYAECLDADFWPSYEEPPPGFGLPKWVKERNQLYE